MAASVYKLSSLWGTMIVQDPRTHRTRRCRQAHCSGSPDYVLPLREIPGYCANWYRHLQNRHTHQQPQNAFRGRTKGNGRVTTIDTLNALVPHISLVPRVRWSDLQSAADQPHYRCHTGHAFSILNFALGQEHAVEEALWNAVRAMEEKRSLFERRASAARLAAMRNRQKSLSSAPKQQRSSYAWCGNW